jgi:hypothetical protein
VTKLFAESPDVAFMDVNLREEAIRESPDGDPYSPGSGGWPTVRYFNKETGIAGGAYTKKTSKPMCQELGNEEYMIGYVEEYGKIFVCDAGTGEGCSEKEVAYIAKMKAQTGDEISVQIERLESMDESSMTSDLFKWLVQRKKILKQLVGAGGSDEL